MGIEVDGDRVTAVVVKDGRATAAHHGTGATTKEKITSALKAAGRADHTRIALATESAITAPATLTAEASDRSRFTAQAHDLTHTSPDTHDVIGLFDPTTLTPGTTSHGLVVAVPRATITDLHSVVGPDVAVTATSTTAQLVDGAALALRDAHAELTLTVGGKVLAAEILRAGGLHPLDTQLGQGNVVGDTRLGAALKARPVDHHRTDPEAVDTLTRYLRLVAAQVAATLTSWDLAGYPVHRTVYAHGRGATAPHLTDLLNAAGLRRTTSTGVDSALTFTDPIARPALVGAYLAAASAHDPNPAPVFVHPKALATARAAAAKAHRRTRTRTLTVATALALAGPAANLTPPALDAAAAAAHLRQTAAAAAADLNTTPEVLLAAAHTTPTAHVQAATAALGALEGVADVTELDVGTTTVTIALTTNDPAQVLDALARTPTQVTATEHSADDNTLRITMTTGERP